MPYLIDGHNLIPKVPGLALDEIDDELQLVEMLQEFCRRQRKTAEVFFDNAPPGQPRLRTFGSVTARFVRQGITADQAIANRLVRLGRAARNWTVISSDAGVQASARAARARYSSAEAFAALLGETLRAPLDRGDKGDRSGLSETEIDEWLELFGGEDE